MIHATPAQSAWSSKTLVILAFAAVYFLWGSTYLAIRYAVETIPPLLMIGTRTIIAGVLLGWLAGFGRVCSAGWVEWRAATVSGALLFLGCHGLLSWAEQTADSGSAALTMATIPGWMVLFSCIIERRAPCGRTVFGLLFGTAGVAVLIIPRGAGAGGDAGALGLILVGAASWAAGSIHGRMASLPGHVGAATAMQLISGGALLLATGLLIGEGSRINLAPISWRSIAALGYLIVFGSVISFTAYNWLLRVSSPAAVGSYAFVNPIIAVVLGRLIADETLDSQVAIAGAAVVTGVVLIHSSKDPCWAICDTHQRRKERRTIHAR